MHCLLPSEKTSIFYTILCNLIPTVIGKSTCEKVKLVIIDADSQEMKACQNACKKVFIHAKHTTCLWNMIYCGIDKTSIIHTPRLQYVLKKWLFFIATHIESIQERSNSDYNPSKYLGTDLSQWHYQNVDGTQSKCWAMGSGN